MNRARMYKLFTQLNEDPERAEKLLEKLLEVIEDRDGIIENFINSKATELETQNGEEKDLEKVFSELIELIKSQQISNNKMLSFRITSDLETFNSVTRKDFLKNRDDMKADGSIQIKVKNTVLQLDEVDKIVSSLGTSTTKLFYYVLHKVTTAHPQDTSFLINVYDYAELNEIDISTQCRKDEFCKHVAADLTALTLLRFKTKRGWTCIIGRFDKLDNKGNYAVELLQSIKNEIRATGARYKSIPEILFKHKNKSRNSFSIGAKLHDQYTNKGHISTGTNTCIGVQTLIEYMPEIQKERHSHFKREQKPTIEKALDENIEIGYLNEWHYRGAGKNGKKFTREEVNKMTYAEFESLIIEFTPKVIQIETKQ